MAALCGGWTLWLLREPGVLQGIDYSRFYFFNAEWVRRHLLAGEVPWWNPHVGLGRPFLADIQTGVFYPPHLVHLFCGVALGTGLLIWVHLQLAAVGMFRLACALGCGRGAAWLASAVFVFGPTLSVRFISGQVHYGYALCWLPLVFWLLVRVLKQPSGAKIAALAGASALQLLCGHPQVYWLTSVGAGVFAIAWSTSDGWRAMVVACGRVLGALVLGLALTAPVFLPFLELVGESNRAGSSAALSQLGAMRPIDWWALLWPPTERFVPDVEAMVHVGVPLLLGATAMLWRGWKEDRVVRALGVLLIVGLVLASEMPWWIHRTVTILLPGFGDFRLPARVAALALLALLLLAARWVSRPVRNRLPVVGGVALTAVTFVVASAGLRQWYVLPANYPAEIMVSGLVRELKAADSGRAPPRLNITSRLVRENSGMLSGHSTFNAYVSLYLARPWGFVHAAAGLTPSETINSFPDVRIFSRAPFFTNAMGLEAGFDTEKREFLLAPSPDPRAYLCFDAIHVSHWREAVHRMVSGTDFHRTALIEGEVEFPERAAAGTGQASIIAFANEKIGLRVQASAPAVLVVAEPWYPGWDVKINGEWAKSFPVNGWMRGVVVPAGPSEVEWEFRQRWILTGCIIATAALVVVIQLLRHESGKQFNR